MRVADAISHPGFLAGTHAIEYDTDRYGVNADAHTIKQVAVARDRSGRLLVERQRPFKSFANSPWPKWENLRGIGGGRDGFFGMWLPHLDDLLADCKLVELDETDRVPPKEKHADR